MVGRLVLPLLFAAMLFAPRAMAAGGLVSLPTEEATAAEAKMAIAIAPSRTTRWLSLRAHPTTAAMWILPVRPGAFVDEAPFAFFEALADATAPRVIPPDKPAPCGFTPSGPEAQGDMSAHVTRKAADIRWLERVTDLLLHARGLGMNVPPEMTPKLEALSSAGFHFFAATHVSLAAGEWLSPLRIVDDSQPVLPLLLSGGGAEATKLSAFVIGPGRASFDTKLLLELDRGAVRFTRHGTSTYSRLRDELLGSFGGGAWMAESVGHDLVFSATALPKSTRPIPSLVEAYLSRATEAGDDATRLACVTKVASLAHRGERVGLSCPGGYLASPSEGCIESPRLGEIDPEALRCEGADELAFAFSGQRPSEVVVTRAIGLLPAHAQGDDVPVSLAKGGELSPLVMAAGYEACERDAGGDDDFELPGGGSSPSPWTPPPFAGEDEAYDPEPDETSAWVAAGCAALIGSEYEDDSGSEESCSSGTGGGDGWDDGDESCDSDGYGGSYDEDDYDSCEGSGGYESSDEEEECSVAPRRKRAFRPRMSVYTLALAALALPIRRRTRPNRQREP